MYSHLYEASPHAIELLGPQMKFYIHTAGIDTNVIEKAPIVNTD